MNDRLHGKAVERYADGTRYEGSFVDGKRHGQGEWSDDVRRITYKGEFLDGQFHGNGKLKNGDGYECEGRFERGLLQGRAKERTSDGESYEGDFVRGLREGRGIVRGKMKKQDYVFEGTFVRGLINGPGILRISGATVEGEFGTAGLRKAKITTREGLRFEIDKDAGTIFRINPDGSRSPVTEKELPEGVI